MFNYFQVELFTEPLTLLKNDSIRKQMRNQTTKKQKEKTLTFTMVTDAGIFSI